jgi:hypothetical protein
MGTSQYLEVFRNTTTTVGAPTFEATAATLGAGLTGSYATLTSGDVNGDGAADLVLTDGGPHLAVLFNTTVGPGTTPTFGAPMALETSTPLVWTPRPIQTANAAIGDLNGDGTADLIAAMNDGGIASFFQTSAGFRWLDFPQWTASEWLAIGDLNGDGRLDAVVTWLDEHTGTGASVMVGD